jgi:hypothetical protein
VGRGCRDDSLDVVFVGIDQKPHEGFLVIGLVGDIRQHEHPLFYRFMKLQGCLRYGGKWYQKKKKLEKTLHKDKMFGETPIRYNLGFCFQKT